MVIDHHMARVGVHLDATERHPHRRRHRFEAGPLEVLDEIDPAVDAAVQVVDVPEEHGQAIGLVEGEEGPPVARDRMPVRGPSFGEPQVDRLLGVADDAIGMVHDAAIDHPHPLEQVGCAQGRLTESVGVGDDVHAHGLAHHVQQVRGRPQLLLDGVETGCVAVQLVREELAVQVPAGDAVEALDHARLPHRQELDRIDRGWEGQRVLDDTPVVAHRADVDADHVACAGATMSPLRRRGASARRQGWPRAGARGPRRRGRGPS